MKKLIDIICKNTNTLKQYEKGISLFEIAENQNVKLKYPILGAMVNNKLKELDYEIYRPKVVKFIDITHRDGLLMYIRSLLFILIKAAKDVFPDKLLEIKHSVSKGIYCEFYGFNINDNPKAVEKIKQRMLQIVEQDISFKRKELPRQDAIKIFEQNNYSEKKLLFESIDRFFVSVYYLDDVIDYFYGYLTPSTSYIKLFDLQKYYDGMLLRIPCASNPTELEPVVKQDKMFEIFTEYKRWGDIIGVGSIGSINKQVLDNNSGDLIKISEALHEKKIAQIADMIYNRKDSLKIILLSGPSASGKTTTSKRLAVQLKVLGIKPLIISLDNYFVDRELTPKDENGEYNFEVIEALDIETLYEDLHNLMSGKSVKMPRFSFETGKRYYPDDAIKISKEHIFIIEGIHALNPKLTYKFDDNLKFKIYVSALTQVGIDHHNKIPTSDNRLIRRIVRDYKYRNYTALDTIKRWASIRRGEEKYIFPFQEEADIMFNSALFYELGVLKQYAEPVLNEISPLVEEYSEARRLLKFLSYFKPIPEKEIPPTSILREFLSNSSFKY